jgi:hypothetical protein
VTVSLDLLPNRDWHLLFFFRYLDRITGFPKCQTSVAYGGCLKACLHDAFCLLGCIENDGYLEFSLSKLSNYNKKGI